MIPNYKRPTFKEYLLEVLDRPLDDQDLDMIEYCEQLEKENAELKEDKLEYQRILDIWDKRTYRKKYLEERRVEVPTLLYPDADEIYERYFKLREENKELKERVKVFDKAVKCDKCDCNICDAEKLLLDSIPKSVIREKMKKVEREEKIELKGLKGQDRYYVKQEFMYKKNILKELLGDK